MTGQPQVNNELWDSLRQMRPSLRSHIRVFPQSFRGERWFVLLDETSGTHLRLNSFAYNVVGRFDGKSTLDSICTVLDENTDSGASPDQEETIKLISQLHNIGALGGIKDKTTAQLVSDHSSRQSSQRIKKLLSPLMIRIPIIDPDRLLDRIAPQSKIFFSKWAFLLWAAVVLFGLFVTVLSFADIRAQLTGEVFKPKNLVLLWVLYPLIKLVHEFAHAISVKRWGGEVHEMGITLLVLTPIPYVNASAASSFRSKWKRCMVSAAGIMAELFIAAIAIILWALSEPGFFNDCMLGLFMIGAVSTVVFNANPLLKFDGYFMLQDLIEIPNLYSRSSAWYRYAFKRYVLKLEGMVSPQTAAGERGWFAFYGITAFLYRFIVIVSIVGFLLGKYLVLGVILAIWAVLQQVFLPIGTFVRYMASSPELDNCRGPVLRYAAIGSLAFAVVVFLLPLPQSTLASGIVWVPQQGQIYASTSGFVSKVFVSPGSRVESGELLVQMTDPDLELELQVEESRLNILGIELRVAMRDGDAEFARLKEDVSQQEELVEHLQARNGQLSVHAQSAGVFTLPDENALAGKYYKQGDLIGHIVDPQRYIVQAVVPESDSALIHKSIRSASIRVAEHAGKRITAQVSRTIPAADNRLPSAAMGAMGGGGIAVASTDPDGLTTIEKVFHLQLEPDKPLTVSGVGERAYVKLHHDYESLATRWFRVVQQVFLKNVPMWIG